MAVLSLIASLIIAFAQKKQEERRSKRSFQLYLKQYFALLLNALEFDKADYVQLDEANKVKRENLTPLDLAKRVQADFRSKKVHTDPKAAFSLLINIQELMFSAQRIRDIIKLLDFNKLMDITLEHGKQLSKDELTKTYGVITVIEEFYGITVFNDRFGSLKTVQRELTDKLWTGLKYDRDFATQQEEVTEDLLSITSNEQHLDEIVAAFQLLNPDIVKYFNVNRAELEYRQRAHPW